MRSLPAAIKMRAGSPFLFLRRLFFRPWTRTRFACFDSLEKHARKPRLAGIVFAVNGAEIEKLVAECVALARLRQRGLDSERKLAAPISLGPWLMARGFAAVIVLAE